MERGRSEANNAQEKGQCCVTESGTAKPTTPSREKEKVRKNFKNIVKNMIKNTDNMNEQSLWKSILKEYQQKK